MRISDWSSDVCSSDLIKIEHPVRGDTQRGFINIESSPVNPERNVMVEHPNRGKRNVGVDVSKPEGQKQIYELAAGRDVFLTNSLPEHRQELARQCIGQGRSVTVRVDLWRSGFI